MKFRNMYRIVHKRIGYWVEECETLEEAKELLKHYGRAFIIEEV